MMRSFVISLTVLASCIGDEPGPSLPSWNPTEILSANDGLYTRLPRSGGVVHVTPEGARHVDLGPGETHRLLITPDGSTALAFVRRTRCEPADSWDARGARLIQDCPVSARKKRSELVTIVDGEVHDTWSVGLHYNALEFSKDGRWGLLWLDARQPVDVEGAGVVDLTTVIVIDLITRTTTQVSVGFAASRVLFADDSARAVVMSQDSVSVIDLTGDTPRRTTVFPLTLEAGSSFQPLEVALTPEGDHVLVATKNRDDLYVLRLDPPSINLVSLSGTPAAMQVIPPTHPAGDRLSDPLARDDRTLLLHHNSARIDLVEHDSFEVDSITLASAVSRIERRGRSAMVWHDTDRNVYALDVDTRSTDRFFLQNLPTDVRIDPSHQFGVALTRPRGGTTNDGDLGSLYANRPGLEVLDLRDGRGRVNPFLLEGTPRGIAFSESDSRIDLLLLQQGVDYLLQLDLLTLQQASIELSAPPAAIGEMRSADALSRGFWITHDVPLGLVTFFDPARDEIIEVSGFASFNLFNSIALEIGEES
jgi:DNA-binding beta-propeller fold protein YncE